MDPTPSDSSAAVVTEQRLHAFSWLFVFLTQLRHAALPLLALLLFGRGSWWEWMFLLGAVGLAVYSLIYSFGFRYRITAEELIVREGIFDRSERHAPWARVQNIAQRSNFLHRLFGVTELRLESAGGYKPEAIMTVIRLDAAQRIEEALRVAGRDRAIAACTPTDAQAPLLTMPLPELLRLGLVTQRGWVLVASAFALFWQLGPDDRSWLRDTYRRIESWLGDAVSAAADPLAAGLVGMVLCLGFLAVIKLLSVVLAVVTFHGFELRLIEGRLRTEAGWLTRNAATARVDRLQRLLYGESWLARRIGRRWLSCEFAGGVVTLEEDATPRLRWLAPLATPTNIQRIVEQVAPGLAIESLPWQPLHPRAWLRFWSRWLLLIGVLTVPALWALGWIGLLLALGAAAGAAVAARGEARFAAWACDGQVLAWRAGWLHRQWTIARLDRGQVLGLFSSPFDRRSGMATVALDTAGARVQAFRLRIPYLDVATAELLVRRIGAAMT